LIIFGDHTKEVKFINFPFAIGGDGVKLLSSDHVDIKYLYFLLQKAVLRLPNLGYSRHFTELKNISVKIPTYDEQLKISNILFLWEDAISSNKLLLKQLELKKKYLENLLTINRIRTKDKLQSISEIAYRVKKSFIPEKDRIYKEIGIRSHAKGIFHKEPITGKSLGNKSVFWIEPDCFVVNIVFAWEQAVAKTTAAEVGMIASHRFPMYKPKEGVLDLDYLLYFFKSAKGKNLLELASPGGAGRNKTLGQSEFLKLKIPVPPIEEQKKIVRLLNAADKEIELQKQKIEAIKLQKKGLMQQLLTGKKRLK
jgi:type I restriction enzyme S subunit